jgi:chaperonin GroEL (HSP60 family)
MRYVVITLLYHLSDSVYPSRFDRGFISPSFVTDVKSQKVEFKPLLLLSEKKISLLQDILPSLEAATQARRPLVIIAEDVNGEALAACILSKLMSAPSRCSQSLWIQRQM